MDREQWDNSYAGGENTPEMQNGTERSGIGQKDGQSGRSSEAEVDYSRAAGIREEIKSQRGASAWTTQNNYRTAEFTAERDSGAQNGYTQNSGFNANPEHTPHSENQSFSEQQNVHFQSNTAGESLGGSDQQKTKKQKKQRPPMSAGTKKGIAVTLIVLLCFAAGIGGGALGANLFAPDGGNSTSNISIDSSESGMDAASVISEKLMPSVVGISTLSTQYRQSIFGTQQGTVEGSGTGFIVDEDGYILTNSHVVDNGNTSQITVDLYDGSEYPGTVLWSDASLDLAVVKIDAKNLKAVELGDSDDVKIGDYAVAIGNPLGRDFERSVTQGIISGLDRTITTTDGQNSNTMQGLLQTDASINSGNSGGPLINSSGQVIGINTAKASSAEGLGFAIPINTAIPVIEEIKENGKYESVYLGITGMSVEDAMAQYQTDFKTEKGVAVLQIYTDSPAAAAGLKEGDVITAIDGDAIDNMSDLKKKLVNYRPGDKITLTVERSKKDITLELTLQAQNQAAPMQYKEQGASGSSGSNGGSGNSGGEPGGSPYGSDLFGGLFGN